MALNTTARSGRWTYLVHIELTGQTLYLSNTPCVVGGQPYQARLRQAPSIATQLTDLLDPTQISAGISLTVDNTTQYFTGLFRAKTWGNRTVKIYIGGDQTPGASSNLVLATHFTQMFEGRIRFPNGVRWNDKEAFISVNDRRTHEAKPLPIESSGAPTYPRYETAEYPTLDVNFLTDPKQLLLGDWSSTAGSQRIRTVCINTTTRKFRISGWGVQQIGHVYKQAGLTSFTAVSFSSVNLTDGSFILDVAFDPGRDVITVHAKGAQTSNGTLIESPSRILKYLLQTHLGIPTTSINVTSFNDLETDAPFKLRKHITEVQDSTELINEICRDVGIDFYIKDGQYHARTSLVEQDLTSISTFYETDLAEDTFPVVSYDESGNFFNSISVGYKFNPETGRYQTTDSKSQDSIDDLGATIHREFQFNWLYRDADSTTRKETLLFVFSKEPINVQATFKNRAVLHYIADRCYLDIQNRKDGLAYFDVVPHQVRGVSLDPETFDVVLTMWDISRIVSYGSWAPDDAPVWASATYAQRFLYGWWTEDDGNVVLGDATTAISKWSP